MGDKLGPTFDLSNEVVTVTESNTGIGYETANALAAETKARYFSPMARRSAAATPACFEPEIDVGSMLCGCFGQDYHNELTDETDGGKGMTKYEI